MQLFSLFKLASFLVAAGNTLAAPTQESGVNFDTTGLTAENFTASDGLVHTIWIARQFYEEENPINSTTSSKPLSPRQFNWDSSSQNQDFCRHSTIINEIGPNAPTTGRCNAIRDWANTNRGHWSIGWGFVTGGHYQVLASDNNCAFGVNHSAFRVRVGNTDLRDLINDSLNRFQAYTNGAWRVRTHGVADCDGDLVENGSAATRWRLNNPGNMD